MSKSKSRSKSRFRSKSRSRSRSVPSLTVCALALLSCSVASPATEVKEALARAAPLEVDAGGARIAIARAVCAAGAPLPALAGVVEALAAAPRPDGRRPVAWQIRVERDRATVGEDALAPDGARASRGVLALVRDGVRWRLTSP